ncbi:DUF1289 domain-containing protein [Pseudomonas sp. NCCP-436]|uniref:DUF1289 domain-containing protein n=1 Tax=Pseudomonas sp. NCCP-436 TaxID=2842481 RepID=UPI001C813A91|nr:DUF1289 domain-containing protein [Pseudomonas sp. NCCP-436]GIZ11177.1 DUF1289 domain-containing protein [Pseudomonas sp. NCCP-436]
MDESQRSLRSPCVQVCALDEQDVCIGCHRTAAEITAWGRLDNEQRRMVLQRSLERARTAGVLSVPS